MTDKELDKNFSSTNDRLEYFEHAPLSEWGFEYFKNRFIKTRRGTPRLGYTYSRYRLSLDNLLHIKELSADKKLLVANLIKELDTQSKGRKEQQSHTSINYYNYGSIGSIGIQDNVFTVPEKRMLEESSILEEAESEEETRESSPLSSELQGFVQKPTSTTFQALSKAHSTI